MNRIDRLTVAMCIAALIAVILMGASQYASGQVPIYTRPQAGVDPSGPVTATTITATTAFRAPDGTQAVPGFSFTNETGSGLWRSGAGNIGFSVNNSTIAAFGTGEFRVGAGTTFGFSANASAIANVADTILVRDAANTFAQKNGTTAQVWRQYFSTTGPVYWQQTARTAGALYTATGGAAQVSYAQTTVPTITTNGGTGPACVGTDTAMVCTIGTAPPAAATFTITFNGTWPAAPSCMAIRATTGATPLVQGVVVGTTTIVVNLSANLVASEKFNVQCLGVS